MLESSPSDAEEGAAGARARRSAKPEEALLLCPQSGSCMTPLIHVKYQGVWVCAGWLWWHNWLQPAIRDLCTSK